INVASSASASTFELLTRFDTGQRCTRNPKERDLDHIPLFPKRIEWDLDGNIPPWSPASPSVPYLRAPAFSSPGRGFSFPDPGLLFEPANDLLLRWVCVRSFARSTRMTNILEQAISTDDGDRATKIIQDALGIESNEVANYCFPRTWPKDREQRARIIGDWLRAE